MRGSPHGLEPDEPEAKIFGFVHGLCRVHGEREIDRLIPVTDAHRAAQEQAQSAFWEIHDQLKLHRGAPGPELRGRIEARFDSLCLTETEYPELNAVLSLLYAKRERFLAALEYLHLPLHSCHDSVPVP